jgi:hypothetical protein
MQFNIIQSVSKMAGHNSEVNSPHQNKEKTFISINVHKHLVFEVQLPGLPHLKPLDFYVGHFKCGYLFHYLS